MANEASQSQKTGKTATLVLFILGLVLSACALFGDHATELPFVLRLIAPSYYHANRAVLTKLRAQLEVNPGDEGFSLIEPYLNESAIAKIRMLNPHTSNLTATVHKVWRFTTTSPMGTLMGEDVAYSFSMEQTNAGSVIPITFGAAHDEVGTNYVGMSAFVAKVDEMKEPNILRFVIVIFILGIGCECVAFLMEWKGHNPESPAQPEEPHTLSNTDSVIILDNRQGTNVQEDGKGFDLPV